jgi:trehalose-phosphatase
VLRGGGVSDGYIAARPKGVSKGLFVNHAIATMKANNYNPDFILAVGDDTSDEPMFEYLNSVTGHVSSSASSKGADDELVAYTVTVGKKPTAAHAFVDDPVSVMDLLSTLIKSAQRDRRTSSAIDLSSMQLRSTSQVDPRPFTPIGTFVA